MRIRGWHIEGFGLLHDFHVDRLPNGLTVVLGPNEAGKTSLLAFIRGALFGYPDRRSKDRQYPPLCGGRHGGRLFVESDDMGWTVERFATPAQLSITQPNGSPGSESDLRRVLGGVDAELHRNVFAFSLSELQEFETLRAEGVRDRIFAAGVVGAGRSAQSAIDDFAAKRAEVGRKRGECQINGLRHRLDELDDALRQAKARAAQHPELRRAADEIDEEQKRIGRELSDARREMAHLDALLAAWPDWDERCQAEAELVALANAMDLADDLGARLDAALSEVRSLKDRDEERRQTVLQLEEQVGALAPDERLAAVSPDVKRLALRIGTIRARRERRGQLDTQSGSIEKRVGEEALRLGAGWTSQSVREFDASIPAAQEISDWGERLRAEEQRLRDAEEQARLVTTAARTLADEVTRRDTALHAVSPVPESQELTERDAKVRKIRAKLAELVGLRADLQSARQRIADTERRSTESHNAATAQRAECARRRTALRSAPELPSSEDLLRRERFVRELRTGLADMATARTELRAASQRVVDARQRAEEAEDSVATEEAEIERRAKALADAPSVPDVERLALLDRSARELRSKLVDLAILQSDRRAAEIRLADRRRDAERRVAPTTVRSPRGPLLAVAVVLAAVAVVLLLLSQFVGAAVAFGAAVVTAILAVGSTSAPTLSDDRASAGVAEAEAAMEDLAERIEMLEGAAKPFATRLHFDALPDLVTLDIKADEIAAQMRTRQDRDRESAALERLRTAAQGSRESATRLRALATGAQEEVDGPSMIRLRDIETPAVAVARSIDFTDLPTVSALEEKAVDIQRLSEKRREHDREMRAVEALDSSADAAHDAAVRVDEELSKLRADVEATQVARLREAESATLSVASAVGFVVIPEPQDVEDRAKEIDLQMRVRQERDRETAALAELRRQAEAAEEAVRSATQGADARRLARDAAQSEWLAWKAAHRCPGTLRPETAQQFFAAVERLRESLARLDDMQAETGSIESEILEFSRAVAAISEQAGVAAPSEATLLEDVLDGLRDRVESDTKLRADRTRITGDLKRARDLRAVSERDAAAAEKRLTLLLAEGKASDERDCKARIEESRRRADLRKRARDAELRMRTRLGIGAQADAVRAEIASGDRQDWEARKQECKATLARLQPAHEDAVRRHQDSVGKLTALEQACDIVALATERESVVAEIREALAEWRRLAIAQSLVQRTLRRYEVERQPAVLTRAAASFSRITDGRYVRLVTREDGIDVITADGGRFDSAALSRGAAEQLYLCLRLALAAEFGRLSVPLPLVMDDILVNFDPERAQLAAQVLLDATSGHQILLFTCHPETVDLLIGVHPGVRIVEIQRATVSLRPPEATVTVGAPLRSETPDGAPPQPSGDTDSEHAVVSALRLAGHPLSRAELLTATGLPGSRWTTVIQALRSGGQVVAHGQKRGTTWGLADWGEGNDVQE